MSKVEWASFTFPPLNLWNMPKHNEIVRLLNEYYYEHYKHLWEEDQIPKTKFRATLIFDSGVKMIEGEF